MRLPNATTKNPIVISNNSNTIQVDNEDSKLLYTAQDVEQRVTIKAKNKEEESTNLGEESD
jgi:hypothetical protein